MSSVNAWSEAIRIRGLTLALSALRSHPEYGPRLRDLDDARMLAVLDLANEVIRRLIPGQEPGPELRTALTAGVCAGLSDRTADDVVAMLREHAGNDADLLALGVPAALIPALRHAITRHAGDWGDPE